jgi:GH25 family lysozyme M1 (1,4-beta-N-acetylmuramidase)
MLNFLDTSNWQGGYSPALTGADAVIVKATQGNLFVDGLCDSIVQQAIANSMPWGFYHFADEGASICEAAFFVDNCRNYFGKGIPVLDWEGNQSVDWVNGFVEYVHEQTGVWPWIYANPWRFNQGGVNPNCARWVASYPDVACPTWSQAQGWECPAADGNVVAWQFCSDGTVNGIAGNVDLDLFYGSKEQWLAYARGGKGPADADNAGRPDSDGVAVLENDAYKVTIERK